MLVASGLAYWLQLSRLALFFSEQSVMTARILWVSILGVSSVSYGILILLRECLRVWYYSNDRFGTRPRDIL